MATDYEKGHADGAWSVWDEFQDVDPNIDPATIEHVRQKYRINEEVQDGD